MIIWEGQQKRDYDKSNFDHIKKAQAANGGKAAHIQWAGKADGRRS